MRVFGNAARLSEGEDEEEKRGGNAQVKADEKEGFGEGKEAREWTEEERVWKRTV